VLQPKKRTFEDKPAVRSRVPLLIGIMGPSGGGKTYSALRLATGIAKVSGGDIFMVDTESRRGLHYADAFRYRHVDFGAPFSPSDYLQVLEHCAAKGAGTVIVDSMSHEHEGPGGVLEWHQAELERLHANSNADKAEKLTWAAWAKPKTDRRRLINAILQLHMNLIFCFRAKEKLRIITGKSPESKGWMPIAGEEYLFEMTVNFLLPPGASGLPMWKGLTAEQEMFLKEPPSQFRDLLKTPRPLDESIGEGMATWAAGPTGKADKEGIKRLMAELVSMGMESAADRARWLHVTIKREIASPSELTAAELSLCMQAAKESA
jgi:AAA domain